MAKFINNVTSADESISRRLNDLETRLERKRPENLTCENCGAPLSRDGSCPYCGTKHKVNDDTSPYADRFFRIEVEKPGIHTIRAAAAFDPSIYERADAEWLARQAMNQIRSQMMENLTAFIKFERRESMPWEEKTLIMGTIRVVDPSFRF